MKKVLFTSILVIISAILCLTSCKKKELDPVCDPTFSVPSGSYNYDINVVISCATDGASIYYTTDGSTPSNASTIYSGPIVISSTTTLKAIACKDGYNDSGIVEAIYTIDKTVSAPVFSVPAGTYDHAINVNISCATNGASIYYTTDGTTPTASSTPFTDVIIISKTTTLKAIAMKNGVTSAIVETEYVILKYEQVETPIINPVSGTYTENIHANIICSTFGAKIYYTLDGSEPNQTSQEYSIPLTIERSLTLKAKAFKEGMVASEVAVAEYVINKDKVSTPSFILEPGTYVGTQTIAIRCLTEGATIYYTTDGTDPTSSSTQYKISFKISESTTVKAIAYKEGLDCSDIAVAYYEITHEKVQNPTFSIAGGTFSEPIQNLTISCATEGAAIHFTMNGDEPTEASATYTQPLYVSETVTIKAKAFKENYEPSDVVEQTYVIEVATDGAITVVNASGTTEYEIESVYRKGISTFLIKTVEGNEMTLNFNSLTSGTYNFPTYEGDPDATCTATFTYSSVTLNFINGGSITMSVDGDTYSLTFTNVSATNNNALVPVVEQVSLSFTGIVL